MASERLGLSSCFEAHLSIDARNSSDKRIADTAPAPFEGRPVRFFCTTTLDAIRVLYYGITGWTSATNTRPALTIVNLWGGQPMAVQTDSAPARKIHAFIIKGRAGDFPASQPERLAMLADAIAQLGEGRPHV